LAQFLVLCCARAWASTLLHAWVFYCEVQTVSEIYDACIAKAYGLGLGGVCVSVHTGSRGLGHQIGTEYMREMVLAAPSRAPSVPVIPICPKAWPLSDSRC
jgi:hypothetical protein